MSGLTLQLHPVPQGDGDGAVGGHHDDEGNEQQAGTQEHAEAPLEVKRRPHLPALVATWGVKDGRGKKRE